MEAVVFLGLLGSGYLYNNIQDKKKEEIIYNVPKKNSIYTV